MRRRLGVVVALAVAALVVGALPASGITFGTLDGNQHPSTGALLADWDPDSPGPDVLCTGTLISSTVFLTAGHCTDFLESEGITQAWVTFAPAYDDDAASPSGLLPGTWTTDPQYGYSGQGGNSDPHDLAVFVLDSPSAIQPAQLPTANLLGNMTRKQLSQQTFTAVGYGTARDTKKTGPHAFTYDGARRYALQTFSTLQSAWITYSMNPSTGNAGGCYGDSGGPHFLGGTQSNLIVSITITGDSVCRSTDKTYRLDTPSARDFLDDFVTLP
jgi:secreted trypsin-like serine protease